jgi:hypothetical protein
MRLVIIFDGNPRIVEIHQHVTCGTLVKLFIEKHGRNLADSWQLKGFDGAILSFERTVQNALINHGGPFYLSLAPGVNS